ncbi:hypothetical protein G3N95_02175 [Paraburkholderia sp. Tr-20389]|uniref:hypothetical protein n=1 Tax=Paraburkholderia sp. Tr-20389 TaxID=2703903 RepID=UPI001981ACAC|nr:hypothetical protein [Paraburkholderia sp. Tr-20389]MBN3751729.1 hypothetical protein [Paraburkholderia sp. Tr-20389]
MDFIAHRGAAPAHWTKVQYKIRFDAYRLEASSFIPVDPDFNARVYRRDAAADREYDCEVAAASKVGDYETAEAEQSRGAAVAVARHGVSQ